MIVRILTLASFMLIFFATVPPASAADSRELVNLPPKVKDAFLTEMRGNVIKLENILAAIAEGNFKEAADIADIKMGFGHSQLEGMAKQGMSTEEILARKQKMQRMGHGKGMGQGQGMGRYMPESFRALGQNFHQASENLASKARSVGANPTVKDFRSVIGAVEEVTSACVSCHQAFRVR